MPIQTVASILSLAPVREELIQPGAVILLSGPMQDIVPMRMPIHLLAMMPGRPIPAAEVISLLVIQHSKQIQQVVRIRSWVIMLPIIIIQIIWSVLAAIVAIIIRPAPGILMLVPAA